MNERVQRMRDRLWDTRPCITAERLVLDTEAYKKFAGDAVPIFRAKVIKYIMPKSLPKSAVWNTDLSGVR